jgi:hypothetical protein
VPYDDSLQQIDLPRPIQFGASRPNHVAIGLPKFLEANGLTGHGATVAVIDSEIAASHSAQSRNGRRRHHRCTRQSLSAHRARSHPVQLKVVPVAATDFDGAQAIADAVKLIVHRAGVLVR